MTKSPNRWALDVRPGGLHRFPSPRSDQENSVPVTWPYYRSQRRRDGLSLRFILVDVREAHLLPRVELTEIARSTPEGRVLSAGRRCDRGGGSCRTRKCADTETVAAHGRGPPCQLVPILL